MQKLKFVLYADLHLHNFKQFVNPEVVGINSRLLRISEVFKEQIIDFALEKEVDRIFDLGDILHSKSDSINIDVLSLFYESIDKLYNTDIRIIHIPGNHIYFPSERDYILDDNKHFNTYVEGTKEIFDFKNTYKKVSFYILPYIRDKKELLEILEKMYDNINKKDNNIFRILLHHGELNGAILSGEYKSKYEITEEELNKDNIFDLVFLGHLHKHQILGKNKNIIYIGSPIQHNWNDSGIQKGFIYLEIDENLKYKWEFIPTKYPEFREIEIKDKKDKEMLEKDNYNYYRLTKVPFIPIPEKWNVINNFRFENIVTTLEEPLEIDKEENTFENYIDLKNKQIYIQGLDKKEILENGNRILNDVLNRSDV